MKERADHLAWCKQRANEYLDNGQIANAIASMMSDLDKHPDTKLSNPHLMMLGIMYVQNNDVPGARRFIDGFN